MNNRTWMSRSLAGTAVMMLGFTLAGCGGGGGDASGRPENELHLAVYGDASNKVEQAMVDTFNETSDVKIVLDTIPGADYQTKLQTIIDTDSAPDIFFNWGGGSIANFVEADLLMPLDDLIEEDPQLKEAFLPSVFETAVVDDKSYGIPMRGTQPVMLFNNSEVLQQAGIDAPPATWDELLEDVEKLKAAGVTPIALGGADQWPTQMWFQYVFDRVAGEGLFQAALDGDTEVWDSEESREALGKLRELIDAGAFGTNFDSVKFTDGGSPTLLSSGRAGFELMGSWAYATHLDANPEFAENVLGYSEFPAIEGGEGDPDNLAGNTNNFYSIHKDTRYPEEAAEFLKLMYSDEFVQEQIAIGNLPTTTNTEEFLGEASNPEYAKYQFDLVKEAPHFQLSWDQAYPPEATVTIHTAVAQFFSGQIDEDGFIKAMQSL
ncbi:xylobiose transport system substrate-binding protein [Arthrobacter sp. PL16]|uniref:Extracellular solute-binding protein n=1 Tax=Arthrobacter cheniae TaxID=1258888 RepID=A0A3A5MAI4_9MICC|nr:MULTISPECIES: extracellular solute-binding protein [Arthrobacter]MEC5198816.1 xylobiose transport system substrate-binding protein [Arthrobacter sp. PL16]RJT83251.1 extracellular solute-binding protein [Arthrobacter cheniae]